MAQTQAIEEQKRDYERVIKEIIEIDKDLIELQSGLNRVGLELQVTQSR